MKKSTLAFPNSLTAIHSKVKRGRITLARPLSMLFSRLVLFGVVQALIAAGFALSGQAQPWEASIAWWPVSATVSNLVCLFLLDRLARQEGMKLKDLYRVEKHPFWRELLICVGVFVVSAPLSYLPNVALGNLLFGDVSIPAAMFFRPLPLWVIIVFSAVLFPVTIALTEIPTYYSYAMPRLNAITGRGWAMVLLAGFMHAAQHMTLPLIFDWRFLLWRLLMFLPFALFLAAVMKWRPRLLPYLMVGHGLLDAQLVLMLLPVAIR
jgi:hypothetical protein